MTFEEVDFTMFNFCKKWYKLHGYAQYKLNGSMLTLIKHDPFHLYYFITIQL
jgi:hypothetical protein